MVWAMAQSIGSVQGRFGRTEDEKEDGFIRAQIVIGQKLFPNLDLLVIGQVAIKDIFNQVEGDLH